MFPLLSAGRAAPCLCGGCADTPAFSTALSFFDGYRCARLPANLLQAQRDYFGAHTFERLDNPGVFEHANWTGTTGRITSNTYQA